MEFALKGRKQCSTEESDKRKTASLASASHTSTQLYPFYHENARSMRMFT